MYMGKKYMQAEKGNMKYKNSLLEADLTIKCRTQKIALRSKYGKKISLHDQYINMRIS